MMIFISSQFLPQGSLLDTVRARREFAAARAMND
jgi:hypothetical protein